MSPAAPVIVVPPVRPAEALPAVRLPWEILAEDSLATDGETVPLATIPIDPSRLAPKAPAEGTEKPAVNHGADAFSSIAKAEAATAETDADGGEWANVPDESLTADAPNEPPFEPLQDAVMGDSAPLHTPPESAPILDAPWVTRPAETAPLIASAAPVPAESAAFGSSSVPPVFQNPSFYGATPTKKSLAARLAPFVGGAVALALAGWLVFGDFNKKKPAHSSTAVAAARPAAQTEKPKHSPPPAAAPAAAAPAPAPTAAAAQPEPAERGPTSTAKFNNKAANVSLAKLLARARSSCKKPGDPSGTALAIVTFANTGRVVATSVSGVKITGTPVATCIANTLKSAKVPPFAGEAVTMKKTLKLK
jgi:hypothetical protein